MLRKKPKAKLEMAMQPKTKVSEKIWNCRLASDGDGG